MLWTHVTSIDDCGIDFYVEVGEFVPSFQGSCTRYINFRLATWDVLAASRRRAVDLFSKGPLALVRAVSDSSRLLAIGIHLETSVPAKELTHGIRIRWRRSERPDFEAHHANDQNRGRLGSI